MSTRQSAFQGLRSSPRLLASVSVWVAVSCGSFAALAQTAPVDGAAAVLTALATTSVRPSAAAVTVGEPALRQAWQSALWPADIARLAAAYVERYPDQPLAAEAELQRARAGHSASLLRQPSIQLFKRAFAVNSESDPDAALMRRAALGDADAALQMSRQLAQAGDARQAHGWLQFASELGSDRASYGLALHYRREAQVLLASQYEARARAQGFEPPLALNHQR